MPGLIIPKLPPSPPRITGNDIPDDIWRIIAGHLEDSFYPFFGHFHTLISVNHSFFHYILGAKYREVRWVKLDRQFMRLLKRLQWVLFHQMYAQNRLLTTFKGALLLQDMSKDSTSALGL
jgi:hypothetical protein